MPPRVRRQRQVEVRANLPPLMKFVPLVGAGLNWQEPTHLAEFVDVLQRAPRGNIRAHCSVPIRHWKTCTVIAAICWWLLTDPTLRIIYMTHSTSRAEEIGKDIRDACERMGIEPVVGKNTIKNWRTRQGGGVSCMSADQSKLGADVDILIWDDPIQSPTEAEKPEVRQAVDDTISFYTNRLSRNGSCIGVMSRFHKDDPSGRRAKRTRPRWVYIHYPAILDIGQATERAFAPAVFTLQEILTKRAEEAERDPTERTFWSQWQNEPRSPSGDLFKDPAYYTELPNWPGFRPGYGLDMSYSQAKIADYSAIVSGRIWGSKLYVLNVERFRLDISTIAVRLNAAMGSHGHGPIFSYVSGPEVGIVGELRNRQLPVMGIPAKYNKLVRAEKSIVRWNRGDVLLPINAPWAKDFVERAQAFRGVEGDDDDEIDALVSLCDGMMGSGASTAPTTFGSWRY